MKTTKTTKPKRKAQSFKLGKSKRSKLTRLNSNSLPDQRQRLLTWLTEKPITTIEARHYLNILAPAPRVYELRHNFDHNILTFWTDDITPEGRKHRVARYVLMPKKLGDNTDE